jgi:hypothetical protein
LDVQGRQDLILALHLDPTSGLQVQRSGISRGGGSGGLDRTRRISFRDPSRQSIPTSSGVL